MRFRDAIISRAEKNRLASMWANWVPIPTNWKLNFTYDWKGRRIQKDVVAWNNAAQKYQLYTLGVAAKRRKSRKIGNRK
jgi:hypothetical protein